AAIAALTAHQSSRRSRPRLRLAVALPAFALALFAIGCGSTGGGNVSSQGGGTPAGSYSLTIGASGGGQSHSSTITGAVKEPRDGVVGQFGTVSSLAR